jgi:transcriptional regulator GlxA family with amidase domain
MNEKRQIGIFVFDGVELLDAAGPMEVFAVADELSSGQFAHCYTFATSLNAVRTVAGMRILPDAGIADVERLDIVIIPGGEGVRHWMDDAATQRELQRLADTSTYRATVCSGALAAAKMNWITGRDFCTHHSVVPEVLKLLPTSSVWRSDLRFVQEGALFTSAGISAGLDLALHLVEVLHSADLSAQVAHYMEYTPQQGF